MTRAGLNGIHGPARHSEHSSEPQTATPQLSLALQMRLWRHHASGQHTWHTEHENDAEGFQHNRLTSVNRSSVRLARSSRFKTFHSYQTVRRIPTGHVDWILGGGTAAGPRPDGWRSAAPPSVMPWLLGSLNFCHSLPSVLGGSPSTP